MRARRRLSTFVAAVTVLGSLSTLGALTPAAQADTPATVATATAESARAPHDPATYYAGTEGLSGAALAARLSTIISGHTRLSYAAVYDALPVTDADPARPGYLLAFYSGTSVLASNRCGSSCGVDGWNREHTWPQSHGGFGTTAGIGTDLFHLRPEFGSTNSSRGNKDYDDGGSAGVPLCSVCLADGDSFEPRPAVKGDLARGLLYMAVRYEGADSLDLKMNDRTCNGSGAPNMGKLSTLVAWSAGDPPDDRERARNDLVDGTYQHNRNPFIDHPEWVGSIFGSGVGAGPACGSTTGTEYVAGGATNRPPTTAAMSATTAEDTATTVTLTATDPDGDPLSWTVSQAPSAGTATVSGSTLTYTPAPDATGSDTVGVTVSDGRGGTATTTLTVTTTPVDDAPVAGDVAATTSRDTSTPVALVATDVDDPAASLTYAVARPPAHGSVTIAGSTATYTPAPGWTGADSFTWTASDATSTSAPATASITVTAAPAANRAPEVRAAPVLLATAGSPATVGIVATDADGDPVSITGVGAPSRGSARISGPLEVTYTPVVRSGQDAFTVTVSDGRGGVASTRVDVEVAARTAHLTVSAPPVVRGGAGTTTITATATAPGGTTPTGAVTLLAAGRAVATLTLVDGVATVPTGSARAGTTTLSAEYAGDALFAPAASGATTSTVTRSTSVATLRARRAAPGRSGVVRVAVATVAGTPATGRVTLRLRGTTLRAPLRRGVATFRVTVPRSATARMTARYRGDADYLPARVVARPGRGRG